DAAGGVWRLRTAPEFALFAVEGMDPDLEPGAVTEDPDRVSHRALPAFVSAGAVPAGPPVEEVGIAVDEDANVLWAAELRVAGEAVAPPAGQPARAVPRLLPGPVTVDWKLGEAPPRHRYPYEYGATYEGFLLAGADLFVRANLIDPADGTPAPGPTGELLSGDGADRHVLRPLAVPASGLRLVRVPMLGRDTHGRPLTWVRNLRRPLDVAVDVPLLWDTTTVRPPEE